MSLRRRVFIAKVLYDKHFHGKNLAKFNNTEIDTTCKLCRSVWDGQQHILRECSDPAIVRCRRRQETSLHRKVCMAKTKRDPMARFHHGYYTFAVDRRPDAHEFWTGLYSDPALLDLEGMKLVIGDIPTDRPFNALRRHCSNYAQAAKAMFVERASRMGEIEAAEARAAMTTKVTGARTAKPEDPGSHEKRKYATWPQQDGQPKGYRRRLDSDDEDELAMPSVDQRAAARSANTIRRYVPSTASERTAPPLEDPMRMQAWLGRVIPVPAHPLQTSSSKAAAKRKNKVAVKQRRKANTSERSKAAGRWTSSNTCCD